MLCMTTKTAAALATTGLPLKLYRQHFGVVPIATRIAEPLDAMAALTKDGERLTIGFVNPTQEVATIRLQVTGVSLASGGKYWEIASDDPMAFNEPGDEPRVTIQERAIDGVADKLEVAPTSIVLYSLGVK